MDYNENNICNGCGQFSVGKGAALLVAVVVTALFLFFFISSTNKVLLIVRLEASPNFDERPEGLPIDTLVLHATERDTLKEVIFHFAQPESKVSAHYTIDREGTIVQHVSEEKRAWHAGVSRMPDGRENVNNFSIGVELVNLNDGIDPYPEAQIKALRALYAAIKTRHAISFVVTHAEVAQPPGRKSDPRGFNLAWLG